MQVNSLQKMQILSSSHIDQGLYSSRYLQGLRTEQESLVYTVHLLYSRLLHTDSDVTCNIKTQTCHE